MKRQASMKQRLIHRIKSFTREDQGNVAIIIGFSIFVLVAMAGSGVDLARSQIILQKMHQGQDAAALAAGIASQGTPEAERTAILKRYFKLNFPDNYMGSSVTSDKLDISYEPDGQNPITVNLKLDSTSPTNFVGLVGQDTVKIASETEVAVSGEAVRDMDVMLVADTTGSMDGNRIENLILASNKFVDILLKEQNDTDNVRVGIISYSAAGSSNDYDKNGEPKKPTTIRANAIKPESTNPYFTKEYATAQAVIAAFKAAGNTDGGYAADEGYRRLALNANTRDDGKTGAAKSFVFMTDGEFNTPNPTRSVDDFYAACAKLKNNHPPVEIFTIKYGDAGNAGMLEDCASEPKSTHFFNIPNPEDLDDVFSQIAANLKKIRITK